MEAMENTQVIIPCRWKNFSNRSVANHAVRWDHDSINLGFHPATGNSQPHFSDYSGFQKFDFLHGPSAGIQDGMPI